MAKQPRVSNAAAIAMCDALADLHDAGAGAAYILVLSGTQPAGVDVAITSQVTLATITVDDPAFGDAIDVAPGAEATAAGFPKTDLAADETGVATWFRTFDSDNNAITDGSVGTSDADMIVDDANLVQGQEFRINSWKLKIRES